MNSLKCTQYKNFLFNYLQFTFVVHVYIYRKLKSLHRVYTNMQSPDHATASEQYSSIVESLQNALYGLQEDLTRKDLQIRDVQATLRVTEHEVNELQEAKSVLKEECQRLREYVGIGDSETLGTFRLLFFLPY